MGVKKQFSIREKGPTKNAPGQQEQSDNIHKEFAFLLNVFDAVP